MSARTPVRVTCDEHRRDPPRDGASNTIIGSLVLVQGFHGGNSPLRPGPGFSSIRKCGPVRHHDGCQRVEAVQTLFLDQGQLKEFRTQVEMTEYERYVEAVGCLRRDAVEPWCGRQNSSQSKRNT